MGHASHVCVRVFVRVCVCVYPHAVHGSATLDEVCLQYLKG